MSPRRPAGGGLVNRLVLSLLGSRLHRLAGRSLVGLEVTGRRTLRPRRFPVSAAPYEGGLVVLPGRPEQKQWWRNVPDQPDVRLLRDGRWSHAEAHLLRSADPGWTSARAAYATAHPRVSIRPDAPLVVLRPRSTRPGPAGTLDPSRS